MLRLVGVRTSIPITIPTPTPAAIVNLTGRGRRKGQVVGMKSESGEFEIKRSEQMSVKATASEGEERMEKKEEEEEEEEVVVQYVVLRRDLIESWPLGSVVTQGCHASVAAIWEHKDDASTLRYCSPPALHSMHKVTLEVKGEPQILNLSEKLKSSGILHKLWIEQPENIPTCLATKPYPKSTLSPFFRKLKLCK